MEVFRISKERYAHALNASGRSARWNRDHQFTLYTSGSRALAALETAVHFNGVSPVDPYRAMVISIADRQELYTRKQIADLPPNWRSIAAYSDLQEIGSEWYESNASMVLVVPSVVIPQEFNYIINLRHRDFTPDNVTLVRTEGHLWDDRLV